MGAFARGRRGPTAPLLVVAALAGLVLPRAGTAEAATSPKVIAPQEDSLVRGAQIELAARVPAGFTHFTARLDDRVVTQRFSGAGGGIVKASVSRRSVGAGRANLVVSADDPSGRPRFDGASFVVGKRDRGFLSLPVPKPRRGHVINAPGGVVHLDLRSHRPPTSTIVRLNGHRVRFPLDLPPPDRHLKTRLSADAGIHFGRNRLTAVAYRESTGRYDVVHRTIFVPRTKPLAAAGRDKRTVAGGTVHLNGRKSRPPAGIGSLRYRWRIVHEPSRSHAKLSRPRSARPRLLADRNGTYRVKLAVRGSARTSGWGRTGSQAARSADVTTISAAANLPPVGGFLQTMATQGGQSGVSIQGPPTAAAEPSPFYEAFIPVAASAGPAPLQIVSLDNVTLAVKTNQSFNLNVPGEWDEAASLLLAAQTDPDSIVIVTGAPDCCPQANQPSGATPFPNDGFSWVSAGGFPAPHTLATNEQYALKDPLGGTTTPPGGLYGYLTQTIDQAGAESFTFRWKDAVPFDTSADSSQGSNTISVNGDDYSASLPHPTDAGFQVMAFDPNLDPIAGFPQRAFVTNSTADPSGDEDSTLLLGSAIDFYSQFPNATVIVQSINSPHVDSTNVTSWNEVAQDVGFVGMTPAVFNALDGSGDYAFVGGPNVADPLETSAALTGSFEQGTTTPGELRGALMRNRSATFVPQLGDSLPPDTGSVSRYDLSYLLAANPVAWPHPATPAENQAYMWIAEQLSPDLGNPADFPDNPGAGDAWCYRPQQVDLRAEYCNLQVPWSNYQTTIDADGFCPTDNPQFSQDDCQTMVKDLSQEFTWIGSILGSQKLISNLQAPLEGDTAIEGTLNIQSITSDITSQLEKTNGEAHVQAFDVLSEVVGALAYVAGPAAAPIGLFSSALGLAADTSIDEGEVAGQQFQTSAAGLPGELIDRLESMQWGIGDVGEILVGDDYKLMTAGNNAVGPWSISSNTLESLTDQLQFGVQRWAWQTLLPLGYDLYQPPGVPPPGESLSDLGCKFAADPQPFLHIHPFPDDYPQDAAFEPIGSYTQTGLGDVVPEYSEVLALGRGDPSTEGGLYRDTWETPDSSLVEPLFNSPQQNGLGFAPEFFYTQSDFQVNPFSLYGTGLGFECSYP